MYEAWHQVKDGGAVAGVVDDLQRVKGRVRVADPDALRESLEAVIAALVTLFEDVRCLFTVNPVPGAPDWEEVIACVQVVGHVATDARHFETTTAALLYLMEGRLQAQPGHGDEVTVLIGLLDQMAGQGGVAGLPRLAPLFAWAEETLPETAAAVRDAAGALIRAVQLNCSEPPAQ